MPRVSVIVPTRDRPEYLAEALASLRSQTYRDFETIIIDDGSQQPVSGGGRPGVRVVRQCHGGRAAARNAGLRVASGELIAFLDDDDAYFPEALERQVAALAEEPDAGVVHARVEVIGPRGSLRPKHTAFLDRHYAEQARAGQGYETFARHCMIFTSTVMVRRTALERAGWFFDEALPANEELDLYLRLSLVTRFIQLSDRLTRYRVHGGNSGTPALTSGHLRVCEKHLRFLAVRPEIDPHGRAKRAFLSHRAWCLYVLGDFAGSRRALWELTSEAPVSLLWPAMWRRWLLALAPVTWRDRLRQIKSVRAWDAST